MRLIKQTVVQKVNIFDEIEFFLLEFITLNHELRSFKDLFQFTCPTVGEQIAATHPRYADPDDCQFFYVCINGLVPRRNGCKLGQVFDEATKFCKWPREVAEW